MANLMIPEGYEKLAAIGIAYKGVYEASKAYGILNAVYHNGSTFVSLKDGPEGEPTGDGVNWQYMAKGFVEGLLSTVQAKDTSGIIGTAGEMVNAQSLLDVIADRVANKLINKNKIVNNLTSTDASAVLAAPQGKTLKDEIGEVNRKLGNIVYGKAILTYVNPSMLSVNIWLTKPPASIVAMPLRSTDGFASEYRPSQVSLLEELDGTKTMINFRMYSQTNSFISGLVVPIWYIAILQ